MRQVGDFEAKTRLGQLLDLVEQGEEVTITRRGRPVARPAPVPRAQGRRRRLCILRGREETMRKPPLKKGVRTKHLIVRFESQSGLYRGCGADGLHKLGKSCEVKKRLAVHRGTCWGMTMEWRADTKPFRSLEVREARRPRHRAATKGKEVPPPGFGRSALLGGGVGMEKAGQGGIEENRPLGAYARGGALAPRDP